MGLDKSNCINTGNIHCRITEFLKGINTMGKELNDIMEFDHIIRVAEDGTITEPRDIYGYFDLNVAMDGTDQFEMSDGWELLQGFTGQYSYNGPVMHPSEFIGGGLERHIRETPGYYVALVVNGSCDYDGTTECDVEHGCECEPAGWAVAFKPSKESE